MSFIHLHVHSENSWLDGACIIDDLIQRAVQLKMPAVAITDRNSVAGASHLWHQCIKAGIKPIIGLEIEVLNDLSDGRAFSVILLAKNGNGYDNLCRLITLAHEHNPLAPKIRKSQLQVYAEDLICLSFSVVGELCALLLEGRDEEARQVSDWYYSVFGEDYYYEIQNHGLPKEAIAMNKLLNLAYKTKIPVVLTNDCHYMERKDSISIDALNCIRKGIDFSHPDAKRFACNEYYFKAPKEMKALFDFPPQLILNTLAIADKIYVLDGYTPVDVPSGADRQNWTPASIYSAVLRTMKVEEEKIKEVCELIPNGAETLLEAVLLSTDFSCLSSQDYIFGLAAEIGDRLIKTFRDE